MAFKELFLDTQQMKNVKRRHIFVSKYLEKTMASRLLIIQMALMLQPPLPPW